MKNKIILIIIIILILAIIAALSVYFVKRKQQIKQSETAQQQNSLQINLFVSQRVISPILSFNGETVWFMTSRGKLFRQAITSASGKEEYPLSGVVENPIQMIWQEDGSNFIIEYNQEGHSRYKFFGASDQTFVDYAGQIRKPQFLYPLGKIVYDWVRSDLKHELKVANLDGTGFEKRADLFYPDYEIIASPKEPKVVLFTANAENPSNLIIVELGSLKFQNLDEKAVYEGAKFSPDGTKLLVTKILRDGQGETPHLRVYDLATLSGSDLGITAPLEQTVWDKDGKGIIIFQSDRFIKYDVATAAATDVYQSSELSKYRPKDLILHPTESLLFFVDEESGWLYKVDLAK